MDATPPPLPIAVLLRHLLASGLGGTGPDGSNAFSVVGLSSRAGEGGVLEVSARRIEASALQLRSGAIEAEAARAACHDVLARVDVADGGARLQSLHVARASLDAVKLQAPLVFPAVAGTTGSGAWDLGPLAAAEGTLRARINDAHLLFDADVTVPVRHGQVNFNDASVAHVGPDSRMGVSRMGLYVDAPNGRSYLYQFTSAAVAGVEYERRGAMLGPWVTSRGKLQLQAFGEGLLRQGAPQAGLGFTDQARLLLGRTAMSGDLQLGDGLFAAPGGLQAVFAGRDERRNAVRVDAEAVGRGLRAGIASLSLRDVRVGIGAISLQVEAVGGTLSCRLRAADGGWRFELDVERLEFTGLRLQPQT